MESSSLLSGVEDILKKAEAKPDLVISKFSKEESIVSECIYSHFLNLCKTYANEFFGSSEKVVLSNSGCSDLLKTAGQDGFENCTHGKFLTSHFLQALDTMRKQLAKKKLSDQAQLSSFFKERNEFVISRLRSNASNCRFGLFSSDCEHVHQNESKFYLDIRP